MRLVPQSGQALVGVLVTLTLVFAMAGGLIMLASGLLTQQRTAQQPFVSDLAAHSAIQGGLAIFTPPGSTPCGPSGGPPRPVTVPSAPPSTWTVTCLRVDGVGEPASQRGAFPLKWLGSSCSETPLAGLPPAGGTDFRVWLAVRGALDAWISPAPTACGSRGSQACDRTAAVSAAGVTVYVFHCQGSSAARWLELSAPRSPVAGRWGARVDTQDADESGSTYVVSAVPPARTVFPAVAADMFVTADGKQHSLMYEGEL